MIRLGIRNLLSFILLALAGATVAAAPAVPANNTPARPEPTLTERALEALVPAKKAHEAAGFFGPVTKKYLPQFEAFVDEYETSTNRIALVARYLPVAEKALAEAHKMRIPPKYEAEKANYLRFFDAALTSAKLILRLAGQK